MFVTADHKSKHYKKGMETDYLVKYRGEFVDGVIEADDEKGIILASGKIYSDTDEPGIVEIVQDKGTISVHVNPSDLEIVPIPSPAPELKQIDWHELDGARDASGGLL